MHLPTVCPYLPRPPHPALRVDVGICPTSMEHKGWDFESISNLFSSGGGIDTTADENPWYMTSGCMKKWNKQPTGTSGWKVTSFSLTCCKCYACERFMQGLAISNSFWEIRWFMKYWHITASETFQHLPQQARCLTRPPAFLLPVLMMTELLFSSCFCRTFSWASRILKNQG